MNWILSLGLVPIETAVRAALFGQDFLQQVRAGPPWWMFVFVGALISKRRG